MRKEIQTANKMEVLFHLRLKHINSWNRHKIMVAYSNLQLAETMNQRNYWWCLSPTSAVFCSLGISGSYSTSINTANPPRTQNINPLSYFNIVNNKSKHVLLTFATRIHKSLTLFGEFFLGKGKPNYESLNKTKNLVKRMNKKTTFRMVSSFHISIPLKKDLEEVPESQTATK